LKINGFGKLENKEIEMSDKINLIYGNNEAGKSTLLEFISSMFYGVSKNKNKKEISNYEKYKPWKNGDFSGKIIYKLDNNDEYQVYREFSKKNPQIYNKNGEDVSRLFNINKTKGNEFFYEQTKIDEEIFFSTTTITQNQVVLDNNEQQTLTQKIANILSTGEESVSYKKTIEKLNKKLLEEVGTERTTERPINLINSKIKEIERQKENIEIDNYRKEKIEKEINEIEKNIFTKNKKIELIKEIKKHKEKNLLEEEKIKINKNIIEEENNKINNLRNQIKENKKIKKSKNFLLYILLGITIINIILLLLIKNNILGITLGGLIISDLIMVIINYLNNRKNKRVEENNKNKKINEIEIAENNVKNVSKKIEVLEKEAKQKNNSEIQSIKFKYNKEIEEKEIDYLMKLNLVMLDNEIEELEKNVSSENIKLHTNKIDYQNLEENENLTVVLEEKFQRCIQERNELQSLGNSINIAKEAIEKAYNRMKSEITPKFTQNLSLIVEKISKGKYKNVKFIDGEGIIVELENGEYVNANKLSLGTIDQLYLSLRLSAIQEITEEHMPIIMDEAFAYYDEERLTNILKYLNELSNENQIIIFTCTNRESKILEQNNIRYKAIEL
jgi:energy-coupling factor transporter ATP-binding protein EcfA2